MDESIKPFFLTSNLNLRKIEIKTFIDTIPANAIPQEIPNYEIERTGMLFSERTWANSPLPEPGIPHTATTRAMLEGRSRTLIKIPHKELNLFQFENSARPHRRSINFHSKPDAKINPTEIAIIPL